MGVLHTVPGHPGVDAAGAATWTVPASRAGRDGGVLVVEPGRRMLGDRYELAQLIAAGGMGQVWRGTDVLLNRPVAVKVLRSEYTGDPTFLARFRAEAQHAAALNHPNIAAVFDYGETEAAGTGEQLAYLVMELVEGQPLSTLLHREGPLDTSTTLSVLGQTAAALAEAHRAGLVHRDVKPGNILVRADGSVKITDFGIAWSAGSVPLTQTGQVIGTPQYLSPEQAEGHLATPASDVYALGLVGYECLAGRPAFQGDNAVTIALKQLRSDPDPLPDTLPRDVRTLIRRALSKDPAARMPDGAAFVTAVEDARAGRLPADEPLPPVPAAVPAVVDPGPPTQAAPGSAGGLPGPRARRHGRPPSPSRRRTVAVLVPLLALLVGAGSAAAVFSALAEDGSPTVVVAETRDGEDGVVVDGGDYLGRPIEDVATQLSALGLSVQRLEQVTASAVPGRVVGVSPEGMRLGPGDDVVVVFAVAPAGVQSAGSRTSSASSSSVSSSSVSSSTVSSSSASSPPRSSSRPPAPRSVPDGGDVAVVTGPGRPDPEVEPVPPAPDPATGNPTATTRPPAPTPAPGPTPGTAPDTAPDPDPASAPTPPAVPTSPDAPGAPVTTPASSPTVGPSTPSVPSPSAQQSRSG